MIIFPSPNFHINGKDSFVFQTSEIRTFNLLKNSFEFICFIDRPSFSELLTLPHTREIIVDLEKNSRNTKKIFCFYYLFLKSFALSC